MIKRVLRANTIYKFAAKLTYLRSVAILYFYFQKQNLSSDQSRDIKKNSDWLIGKSSVLRSQISQKFVHIHCTDVLYILSAKS